MVISTTKQLKGKMYDLQGVYPKAVFVSTKGERSMTCHPPPLNHVDCMHSGQSSKRGRGKCVECVGKG
jgi:hypothetical protein